MKGGEEMDQHRNDPEFDALIDEYVRSGRKPSLAGLNESERDDVEALLRVADLVWEQGHGAPSLEADPIAAALGLVPDPETMLEPRALKSAMAKSGLQASEVARQLKAREWAVETRDVFAWTTRGGPAVSPALVRAIADIVGTSAARLTGERRSTPFELAVREVVRTPAFESLAERWAHLHRTTLASARTLLAARMPAAAHRGDHPDTDQILASLETLVTTLEADNGHDQES